MNDGTPIQPARNVELGASGEEFQNLHEFVRKARARLNNIVVDAKPSVERWITRMPHFSSPHCHPQLGASVGSCGAQECP